MIVINKYYKWAKPLVDRERTDAIVLHHSDGYGTPEEIHKMHVDNGWAGIGYHFYIRLDGTIYSGRPLDKRGAHTLNYNWCTVGVCCEGRYNEPGAVMPLAQLNSLKHILKYLKTVYPDAEIKCHRDYNATACPGAFFPFGEVLRYKTNESEVTKMEKRYKTVNELPYGKDEVNELVKLGVIKGTGADGEAVKLDFSLDMLRLVIYMYRLFKILMDKL